MTELDDELVPEIAALIAEVGTSIVFETGVSESDYDPTTGRTTSSPVLVSVLATPPGPYEVRLVDGSEVLATDLQTLISASGLTFDPEGFGKATYRSKVYTVVSVQPIPSGDEIAAYAIQLRR